MPSGGQFRITTGKYGLFLVSAYTSATSANENAYAIVIIEGSYNTSHIFNNNKDENGITLTLGDYGYIGGTSTSGNDIVFVYKEI